MNFRIRAFLSLLLCVCLLFGTIPASLIEVKAEEEESAAVVTASEDDYLDESVTVDISPLQDDSGEELTTALTGERLTAVISAYNDNPNYTATATIRIYVEQITGNSEIELTEVPEVTLSGAGSSDKTSAATVEAVWHAAGETEADGTEVTVPYLEVTIPSGASIVFYMTLLCPTGYDKSASAQIYAEITETDEENNTETTTSYPEDSSDRLTFTWTGEANWSAFTKTASITAIGVADGEVKADEVDWSFSAVNNTTGSTGVIYTNYITMTDTLVLPEGLTAPTGSTTVSAATNAADIKTTVSGKTTVGEIQDGNGNVVYGIFLNDEYKDSYTLDSLTVTTNADGLTEISYSITIENPDVTDVTFNPVSAVSTAIYIDNLTLAAAAVMQDKEMKNTAELTVYSVVEDTSVSGGTNPTYEVLYQGTATSTVVFDTTYSMSVAKSVYQVTDGIGNVTYGHDLNTSVGTVLSNEKVDDNDTDDEDDDIPYVAQGYTVTYQVTVSSTFTTANSAVMTDTIPSELTLDEDTIKAESGSNALVNGVGYTYTVSTDGSGNTTLTVNITAVPANGSVVITYSCTVNSTATIASTEITNTATVGNKEATATVKTPEDGEVKITREIIQRTTTTSNGYTLIIYKDLDKSKEESEKQGTEVSIYGVEASSYALLAYFGTANPTDDELADAISKVNAGDTIEYLITVENNSLEDANGVIYDSHMFAEYRGYGDYSLSYAGMQIGNTAGGWAYYSMGCSVYLQMPVGAGGDASSVSVSGVTETQNNLLNLCKYQYSDLETYTYGVKGAGDSDGTKRGMWQFYSGDSNDNVHILHACTTYHQTTLVQIPGDNKVSSASETNAGFQNVVSSYSYYCYYGEYSNVYEWADYAIFVPSDAYGVVDTSSVQTSDSCSHTVERQIYLNTGTLASTVVEDASELSTTDGLITAKYAGTSLNANDYENSSKYFSADENAVVVNYVYLYNDSSEAMNLADYSVSIVLPNGFEWVGFTYPYSSTSDSSGMYRTYSETNVNQVFLKNYYSGLNYDLWVNNTRSSDGTISARAYATTVNSETHNNESYYSGDNDTFPQTYSQMPQVTGKNISTSQDSVTDELQCTTKSIAGAKGMITFTFINSSGEAVISPYSGIVIMYVAKVSDETTVKNTYTGTGSESNAAATFQAYIERVYNSKFKHSVTSTSYCMSQLSPVIRAQDVGSITDVAYSSLYTGNRKYITNDGNANTFLEHNLDNFYVDSSNTVAGGTAANLGTTGNVNRMWSYVSLSMYAEKTSVSVTKEVVKNSGSDYVGEYSNGALKSQLYYGVNRVLTSVSETGGFTSDYDDYFWEYSLFDGLHRTVDGTVTWKTTITNTGADTSGNTETETSAGVVYDYSTVNYSTLIDTVDSPYHLIEIAVPYLAYVWDTSAHPVTGASGYQLTARYTWVYYELPDADPSDPDAMSAAGWQYDDDEECFYYESYAKYYRASEMTDLGTLATASPYYAIRVTVRCLDDGSLGWGFDADADNANGNQNTCAYQYLIEFIENLNSMIGSNSVVYEPLLLTETDAATNTYLRSSLDLYLTFSTDDSIETNYNSFALALKDTLAADVAVEDGELTTVADMHTSDTATNATSLMSSKAATGSSSYNASTAGSAGYISSDTVVVQSNDWTDTSYTYGEKTLTVLDDDGNVATDDDGDEITVNSTDDGDMTLPASVTAGTTIHNTLKWESVLYESENYSGVTDLVLYDVYGVQADVSSTGEIMSGYDVDFSTITVQLCLTEHITANNAGNYSSTDANFQSTELVLGTDYEIYYTTAALVTTEHHPISVNTLYYAADLENLDATTVTWVEYDPNNSECDGTGALAFKIVLLDTGAAGTIWNGRHINDSDWLKCEIYVDYNATVSDSVIAGECYPNVLAWTADVIYPTSGDTIYKSIAQDTTAMFFEVSEVVYPKLTKTVVDEDDADISSKISSDEEFTYLIFRTNRSTHRSTNLNSASNITGIAVATVQAGQVITLNDDNLTVLYNTYDSSDYSADAFWNTRDSYYYIVEIDSGNYTEDSISFSEVTGENEKTGGTGITSGTAASLTIGSLTDIAAAITTKADDLQTQAAAATDADEKATLEAQAALYQSVATYLSTGETAQAAYFSVADGTTGWAVTIAGVNKYIAPKLVIRKTDESSAVIMNEVTFEMQDANGNTLSFTKTSDGYAYAGTDSGSGAGGGSGSTTTELVFNGTTSVTGLPEGTYYLVETSAPAGYEISTEEKKFTIAAERDQNGELVTTVEVSVINKEDSSTPTGSVKLVKIDDDTELAITGTDASAIASFQIYDSNAAGSEPLAFTQDVANGNPVAGQYTYTTGSGETTISTDASTGTLNISDLPIGTYYLVETSAPDGYLANYTTLETAYEFTVSRTDLEMEIDFPNTYIQADIVITKTDTDGNAITANPASFVLTDGSGGEVTFTKSSDGVYTYSTTGTVTTLQTSSADGTLTLKDLPKGTYTLTETGAPKGYSISTEQGTVSIIVKDNTTQQITVKNETASMRLRIAKTWRLEGGTKTYAFSGVNFTLYQVDASGSTASEVANGTTDSSGILDLEDLDWSAGYYLYEEVPDGYSASGSLSTVYLEDATGVIDLSVTESTDGYTAISCIYIDMASTMNSTNSSGTEYCTYTDNAWTYEVDVLNVKNNTYGGMYASTSYKTISNAKTAALYDWIEEETGYSYFYQQSDYDAGNYNYVQAVQQGDTVTYTLNISNVSDYDFSGPVIIDRLPESGDTGIVNSSAERSSEFTVAKPTNMTVTVDGKEVSTSLYTVTYSSNTKFTDGDFNGTTTWDEEWTDDESKSFRIVFDSSFTLDPGQTVVVTYDGVVGDDAEIGELAWNNFAYRYTVYDDSSTVTASLMTLAAEEENNTGVSLTSVGSGITGITLTPEPPKVGVYIGGESYTVTKQWEDDGNSLGLRPDTVTLKLSIEDSSGDLTAVDNGTVKLTFTGGENGEDDTITAEIVNPATNSTVEVEASFDADGNWVCQWSGLDVPASGSSYVVEETDTGNANYVWSFAKEMVDDGSGELVESESRGILTNTLQFTTLNLKKLNGDGSALADVQFTLERQTDTGEWVTVETVNTVITDENGITVTSATLTEADLTTDNNGEITITGLAAGTYRITEVKTKEGYTLLTEPLVVELPIHYTEDEVTQKGLDVTGSDVYLTGGTWYFYNVTYTISNTANFTMPSAGAFTGGEWVSGLLGAMLLAGAWIILQRRRRTDNLFNHLPYAQRVKCRK